MRSVVIDEISLGRSKSPIKLANKLATQHERIRFRLPFTVRGVEIKLRTAAAPNSSSPTLNEPNAELQDANKAAKTTSINLGALATNPALRLLLGILPSIPVRIKQLTVVHEVSVQTQAPAQQALLCDSSLPGGCT